MTAKIIQFPGSGIGKQILELKNVQTRLAQEYMQAVGKEREEIHNKLRSVGDELFCLAMELVDQKKAVKPPARPMADHTHSRMITIHNKFEYKIKNPTESKEDL